MTAVDKKIIKKIGTKLTSLPSNFNAHPTISRIFEAKKNV